MTEPESKQPHRPVAAFTQKPLEAAQLQQLRAELKAPYRGVRRFFYATFAGSAALGAFVFFFQVLAGKDWATTVPNLLLQLSVLAVMVWLLWIERSQPS